MRIVNILLIGLMVVAVSCKSSKKSSKSDDKMSPIEASKAESAKATAEAETPVETKEAVEVKPERPAPKYPDSLFLRIDRSPCYGQCPVYRVDIYHSGLALMEGKKFFDYEGHYRTQFAEGDLEYLLSIAQKHGYFELDHVYDAPVTDLPSTVTIVNTDQQTNWVYNRFNSPDAIRAFELEIETIIKERQWKPYEPVNRD